MKYIFLAVTFFSLGYVIPAFTPVIQLAMAISIVALIAMILYFYVDTVAYSRITE